MVMAASRGLLALFALFALYVAVAVTPAYMAFISGQSPEHETTMRMLAWFRLGAGTLGAAALAGAVSRQAFDLFASEWMLFLAPLLGAGYLAGLKVEFGLLNRFYIFLVHEDGLLEVLSFLCFFFASSISIAVAVRAMRLRLRIVALFHFGLSAFQMFVALEEISYGQRILDYSTPSELLAVNRQDEFNFHNIRAVEWLTLAMGPLAVSLYGLLGGVARITVRAILPESSVERQRLTLLFPPWYLSSYFLPLATFSFIAVFLQKHVPFWVSQDQEAAEFFLSVGFLLFSIIVLTELGSRNGRQGRS